MSAEATLAVMEHATGTDAEWRMLMLLANEASAAGIVTGVSMADLARRMGKSERGAAGVKGRLKASEQLVVIDEGGGRGRPAVYWINLPGLVGETPQNGVKTPQSQTEKEDETPQSDSSKGGSADGPIGKKETEEVGIGGKAPDGKPSKVKAGAWNEFWEAAAGLLPFGADLVAAEPDEPLAVTAPREVTLDAIEGLGQTHKVGGKVVTPRELALAATAIAAFNRCFEYDGKKGSDYGLLANLTQVVMRIRERPSWDAAAHVRLVESAWRLRWWERSASRRRPTPNVIWSPKSFEQVVQDATAEKDAKDKGQKPTDGGRRFTRRLKDE